MIQARHEWPMATYLAAWKTFRRLSNENEATARHLVQQPHWPKSKPAVITDVGCGDGRLMEAVLLNNPAPVNEVRFVDPDPELLVEAVTCAHETGLAARVVSVLGGVEDVYTEEVIGADAVLAVHLVYLLDASSMDTLLTEAPVGVPLYVVLDAPGSIFTTLWARTAPKYHERAVDAHERIRRSDRDRFEISSSSIVSNLGDPYALTRGQIRDAVISILCYSAIPSHSSSDREWIEQTIRGRVQGGQISCESTCYEIIRTR